MRRRFASILLLLPRPPALGRNLPRFRILLRGTRSRRGVTPSIATDGFLFGVFLVGALAAVNSEDGPHERQARAGIGSQ